MDTILYFGSRVDELGLDRLDGARPAEDGSILLGPRRIVALAEPSRALAYIRQRPVEAAVLDARTPDALARTHALLESLFPSGRLGGPLLRQRILALVDPREPEAAFALGQHGIGGVLAYRDPSALIARVDALLSQRGHGKIAICLAGGGIEGLLYELGVLRALQSFLPSRAVVDFDLFLGISAGAIVASLLANGIGPEEILRSLEGDGHRLDPIGRWDLFEPNVGELRERLWTLTSEALRGGAGPRGLVSSLTRAAPSAVFSGKRLGKWLERQLTRPSMIDRFSDLRRPLYIGATDQDTAEAVLFGEGELAHVPIHRAVHASCALVPFYPPVEIDGRRYIDGAFSRTTNMRVAAQKGATLVILIDPLVPVRSREAGYVHARGGIFGTTQSLKALINGRFAKAVDAISGLHPDVVFHLFRPEEDEMRILSGSPMKYFYRREVETIAYETTVQKLQAALPQLERDFGLHGVAFRDPQSSRSGSGGHPRIEPDRLGA
ncbi:MAG: patatin-like phospholipase family protein [Sandaracinaceae bacterium]